uniref:Uncharacterized protein n=1 Tax=Anguilla anguilla TaxID=7936 RepID=A0A0E9TQ83_ANGAN
MLSGARIYLKAQYKYRALVKCLKIVFLFYTCRSCLWNIYIQGFFKINFTLEKIHWTQFMIAS